MSKTLREMFHVTLQIRMPERIEVELVHFGERLLWRPVFESHAIGGDKYAGAVLAIVAVHEDSLLRTLRQGTEKFRNLFVRRTRPIPFGNQQKLHSEAFCLRFFAVSPAAIFAAQSDHGRDAEFSQRLHAFRIRLRAAEEMIVDFSRVVDAGQLNFFRERRIFVRNGDRLRLWNRKSGPEREENCARRAKKKTRHRELYAKSLEKKSLAHEKDLSETAPLDIDAWRKSYLDFAIFS